MNGIFSFARFSVVMLIAGLVVLAGCSRPTGSVSGKVSYNGKVLKGGKVVFVSTNGGQSVSGPINEDGTYLIHELPTGSHKSCVDTSFLKGASGPAAPIGAGAPGGPKGPPSKGAGGKVVEGPPTPGDAAQNTKKYVAIPDKY